MKDKTTSVPETPSVPGQGFAPAWRESVGDHPSSPLLISNNYQECNLTGTHTHTLHNVKWLLWCLVCEFLLH